MDYRLNLPWRFYFSLLIVFIPITYAWDQVDDDYFKFIIKYISAVFYLLCIVSAFIVRGGYAEQVKKTS